MSAPPSWSDDAKVLLDFLYRSWAAHRRPPDLATVAGGTGMGFRQVRRTLRELQEGFAVAFTDGTLNLNLAKVTPFSATPTPVHFEQEGAFHSYVGCPAEAITVSAMPMFADSVITVRSWCACCFAPIELQVKNQEVLSTSPADPIVSIVGSPYEWEEGVPPDRVCDSIHFVLDVEHAERYERLVSRRGVTMTLSQLIGLAVPVGRARMWDPDWPPMRVDGHAMVAGIEKLGVDVGVWR